MAPPDGNLQSSLGQARHPPDHPISDGVQGPQERRIEQAGGGAHEAQPNDLGIEPLPVPPQQFLVLENGRPQAREVAWLQQPRIELEVPAEHILGVVRPEENNRNRAQVEQALETVGDVARALRHVLHLVDEE
ncbi:hypothetical protein D3C85_1299810 [compost metagenome]